LSITSSRVFKLAGLIPAASKISATLPEEGFIGDNIFNNKFDKERDLDLGGSGWLDKDIAKMRLGKYG
jgi:hypothetical protein